MEAAALLLLRAATFVTAGFLRLPSQPVAAATLHIAKTVAIGLYISRTAYKLQGEDKKEEDGEDRKERDGEDRKEEDGEKDKEKSEDKEEEATDAVVKMVKESTDLDKYEERLLWCIVDGDKLATTFNDVCIPGNIVDSLRTIVSLPLLYPTAFKDGILGRESIGGALLYGPPGTGKTLVCRALARESGARMLHVKPSDILDMWVGESEKLAKSIFSLAYRLAPCVIFFDEMDALFKARGSSDRPWHRNVLSEVLQCMDGLQSAKRNKDAKIVVVGATNRPYDLDDAVLRRLGSRMLVDLPGEQEREQILRLHLRGDKLSADVDLRNIASNTLYYSGSDLKNLCVSAAMASVKEAIGDFKWTPEKSPRSDTDKSDRIGTPFMTDEAEWRIQNRMITLAHFTHAINEVPPSSSKGSHAELRRWHKQFGSQRISDNNSHSKLQTTRVLETGVNNIESQNRYCGKVGAEDGGTASYRESASVRTELSSADFLRGDTEGDHVAYFRTLMRTKDGPQLEHDSSRVEILNEIPPDRSAQVYGDTIHENALNQSLHHHVSSQIMKKNEATRLLTDIEYETPPTLLNEGLKTPAPARKVGDVYCQDQNNFRDDKDLDKAISTCKDAAKRTLDGNQCEPDTLHQLGISLIHRFERYGNLPDVNDAIFAFERCVTLTPEDHPDKSTFMTNLGHSLLCRFEHSEDLVDVDRSILVREDALQLIPEGHVDRPNLSAHLGCSLITRFEYTGDSVDIDRAISLLEDAVRDAPEDHADKPTFLTNLGISFSCRFELSGRTIDIDKAISAKQDAVRLSPEGHANKPAFLNNLGISLTSRFERFGDLVDINTAISVKEEAVRLIPQGHTSMPAYLNNLGTSFASRFERSGDLFDIRRAISVQEEAVRLVPDGHANKVTFLSSLGTSLTRHFEHTGKIVDINRAISVQEHSLQLTPNGHAKKPSCLNNLAASFTRRFEHFGDLVDIDKSISFQQAAVQLTDDGRAEKPGRLNNLGASLYRRFERSGDLIDIDRSISAQEDAVQLLPKSHADRPTFLSNLGVSYTCRFEHSGDIADIDRSILIQEDAVQLTPEDHSSKPNFLSNLCGSFTRRFESSGNLADIDKAISVQEDAVRLIPNGHALKPDGLNNLGNSLTRRFECSGDISDIRRAISVLEYAMQLYPDDYTNKPTFLSNFGASYMCYYNYSGDLVDIDKSISILEDAVRLAPDGHADKIVFRQSLGMALSRRFEHSGDLNDMNMAISQFRLAATSSTGSPSARFDAALEWARLAFAYGALSWSLDGYAVALDLLPRVAWLGQTISARYDELASIGDLSNESAAAACALGQYVTALEWLEQGRSIVWGQLLHLRTPVDLLRDVEPSLADDFTRVSRALEHASTRDTHIIDTPGSGQRPSNEQIAQGHRRLAEEWDLLVAKAQTVPGFEDFLRPKQLAQLSSAARSGPVVVVNVHERRCDALVLTGSLDGVRHIPLNQFSYDQARRLQRSLNALLSASGVRVRDTRADTISLKSRGESVVFQEILSALWSNVVKPVLDGIGFNATTALDPPRIWWCTTGPLAFLPIHAAGIYNSVDGRVGLNVFDFACSSYTPTLTAIIEASSAGTMHREFRNLLTICQPNTPGLSSLPNTKAEMIQIQKHAHNFPVQCLEGPAATVESVLEGMGTHSWVHFACHAVQDIATPTRSAFCCHDGRLELSKIITKTFQRADLAFLSACQTAAGDEKLSEEAVHLAAGMLLAGYRGIIATMWSIKDEDAPVIAEEVYSQLFSGPAPDGTHAAHALHRAVKHLRTQVGDPEFLSWVPFIHVGI